MNNVRSAETSSSVRKVTTTIHDELTWGLTYRNQDADKVGNPLQLACSPLSVHQYSIDKVIKKVSIYPPTKNQQSKVKRRSRRKEKCVYTRNLHAGAVDLLGRSILNQKQYMNVLSIPNRRCFNKPRNRRRKRQYLKDHCSPRIIKLSLPRKTHVLATWKDHQYFLSTEFIVRLHDLLHTENNINLKDVRQYFKKYDRKKRKLMKILRNRNKKRKVIYVMLLKDEVRVMGNLIINYFLDEPSLDLSFKQLLMSSLIMDYIGRIANIEQPISRNVVKPFQMTLIEICDKLAVWMDSVLKFVDIQPIDDEDEFYSEIHEEYEKEEEESYEIAENYENIGLEQIDEEEDLSEVI